MDPVALHHAAIDIAQRGVADAERVRALPGSARILVTHPEDDEAVGGVLVQARRTCSWVARTSPCRTSARRWTETERWRRRTRVAATGTDNKAVPAWRWPWHCSIRGGCSLPSRYCGAETSATHPEIKRRSRSSSDSRIFDLTSSAVCGVQPEHLVGRHFSVSPNQSTR